MLHKDYEDIYNILASDDCFWSAKDDSIDLIALPAYISRILKSKYHYVLKPAEGTLFFSWPVTSVCFEMHAAIMKKNRKQGVRNARLAAKWLFDNTPCKKLISYVPSDNECAKMFCSQCGMGVEGLIKNSIQKNGQLLDLVLYGGGVWQF